MWLSSTGVFDTEPTELISLAFRHFVGLIHSPPVEPGFSELSRVVDQYLEGEPFNQRNPLRHVNATRKASVCDRVKMVIMVMATVTVLVMMMI